jgi:glutathione synthase/RimK-type ligase-like ATP-grasp enzyme
LALYRLGVLAVYDQKKQLEELSFYRKLSQYGQKLGIEIEVFTPDHVKNKNKVKVFTYSEKTNKWSAKYTTIPPLIYDRCRYRGAETYQLLRAFRRKYHDLQYLSKPLANKWRLHHVLESQEFIQDHLPPTEKYNSASQLLAFVKKHQIVYVKPKNGTGGRGILRIERIAPYTYLMKGRNLNRLILAPITFSEKQFVKKIQSLSLNDTYIIQKGIQLTLKNGRVHDYRLLIQKNSEGNWSITGCAGRIGPAKSVTSNLHGGGMAVRLESILQTRFANKEKIQIIKKHLSEFAHELAQVLDEKYGPLCELGLDLAIDPKGKIWLIEVNPKPSRDVFRRIQAKDMYRNAITRPLEYAKWLYQKLQKNPPSQASSVN